MSRDTLPTRFRDRARHARRLIGAAATAGARRLIRRRDDDDAAFGEALVGELDQLKGMAMKVGQVLSYMDGVLPDETQRALGRLQRGVEPLHYEVIAEVLADELGRPVEEAFDRLDPEPIAAASIGQVHRGAVGGREVAVKVQYPGVAATFESDVAQLRRIARLAGLATRVDAQAIVTDIQQRLREECDYTLEASWQRRFRASLEPLGVHVPEVLDSHSTARVLTSTWAEGLSLEAFVERGDTAAQDRAGLALVAIAWHSLFAHRTIHADPHPGNQLFGADGTVTLLDFGSVRTFEPDFLQAWRRMVRAVLDGERARFREAVLDAGLVAAPDRLDWDLQWEMERHLHAPYLTDSFTFDREWLAAGVPYTRPGNPNLRRLAAPPSWIWLQRLQWGLHAVLVRLHASGDFRTVLRDALDAEPRPLGE